MSLRSTGRAVATPLFLCVGLLAAAFAPAALAQEAAPKSALPAYRMVKLPAGVFKVDGRLDEEAWSRVPAIDHFTENLPVPGPASRHRTELRMAISGHDP